MQCLVAEFFSVANILLFTRGYPSPLQGNSVSGSGLEKIGFVRFHEVSSLIAERMLKVER